MRKRTYFLGTSLLFFLSLSTGFAGSWSDNPEGWDFYRIDCRYHNVERNPGVSFCYGSAVYRLDDREFQNVHLAIGCDDRTFFNQDARVHTEMTLDRIQPKQAATPAIEVFPHGQLTTEGTYTSELDISYGRFNGLCYVHKLRYERPSNKKPN